uniref:Uncharacterized protein n=1 Tax=Panagrolaimus sp. JU765 TaxID=591449 RepID=A0AC34QKE9_9BILA
MPFTNKEKEEKDDVKDAIEVLNSYVPQLLTHCEKESEVIKQMRLPRYLDVMEPNKEKLYQDDLFKKEGFTTYYFNRMKNRILRDRKMDYYLNPRKLRGYIIAICLAVILYMGTVFTNLMFNINDSLLIRFFKRVPDFFGYLDAFSRLMPLHADVFSMYSVINTVCILYKIFLEMCPFVLVLMVAVIITLVMVRHSTAHILRSLVEYFQPRREMDRHFMA